MTNHFIIVVVAVLLAICVVIQFITGSIKTLKINELEEDKELFNTSSKSTKERLSTMIKNQESSYTDLHRRFLYAMYILNMLNKEWYNKLRIVGEDSVTCPTLRLSSTNGNYDVYTYSGQRLVSNNTKFLIEVKEDDTFVMLSDILGTLQNGNATDNKLPDVQTLLNNIVKLKNS